MSQEGCSRLIRKVAVVTGSTDGIGYAISKRLLKEGASVVISSRKTENVENAVSSLKKEGENVAGTVCHVGKEEDRQKLLDFAVSTFGGVDILVCNAAVSPIFFQILDTTEEAWDKIFDVNVKAAFLLTKAVVPMMEKRGGGSLIYVSSAAAYQPVNGLGAYSVSKTALLGLTKAVALQCASKNVRVNCICPGIIETKFSKLLWENPQPDSPLNTMIPMKRSGSADECAGLVAFLCSDDASYMTGESITVAGGYFTGL